MLPGCGKKHTNLSAGSPFEVYIHMSTIMKSFINILFLCYYEDIMNQLVGNNKYIILRGGTVQPQNNAMCCKNTQEVKRS